MSVAVLAVGLLPASRVKNALLTRLGRGWSIAPSARVHPVLLWRVGRMRVGERARIGPANVLRDLAAVELEEDAGIGQFNWATAEAAYAEQSEPAMAGRLVLRSGAAIASRHYLDCAGGLEMGRMSIVAGVRCTVLTHWADHLQWKLRAAPVRLGAFAMLSSASTVTAGVSVADGCIVAAGAVVPKSLSEPAKLCAGVPAKPVADLSDAAHARRAEPRFARPTSPPP